jgi:hypothetical protein
MAIQVKAANDLLDLDDGTISVPKGTAGTVTATDGVPSAPVYTVSFAVSAGPVVRKVASHEVKFTDGKLGPARAWLEGSMVVLSSIRHTQVAADYEQQLGDTPIAGDDSLDIVVDGVGTLRISSNRNSGALDVVVV